MATAKSKEKTKTKTTKPVKEVAPVVAPAKPVDFDNFVDTFYKDTKEEVKIKPVPKTGGKDKVEKADKKVTKSEVKSEVKKSYLDTAKEMVDGDREKLYGHPYENWSEVACMWSVILNCEVTPQLAVLCMIAMKICREKHMAKPDNMIDIAGYTHVYERVMEKDTEMQAANDEQLAQILAQMSKQKA